MYETLPRVGPQTRYPPQSSLSTWGTALLGIGNWTQEGFLFYFPDDNSVCSSASYSKDADFPHEIIRDTPCPFLEKGYLVPTLYISYINTLQKLKDDIIKGSSVKGQTMKKNPAESVGEYTSAVTLWTAVWAGLTWDAGSDEQSHQEWRQGSRETTHQVEFNNWKTLNSFFSNYSHCGEVHIKSAIWYILFIYLFSFWYH